MNSKCQDPLPSGTIIDFRPTLDRVAELEHTYLEESVLAGVIIDADAEVGDLALGIEYLARLLPTTAAFQHSSHRLIYACCLQLHKEGLKPTLQGCVAKMVGWGGLISSNLNREHLSFARRKKNSH